MSVVAVQRVVYEALQLDVCEFKSVEIGASIHAVKGEATVGYWISTGEVDDQPIVEVITSNMQILDVIDWVVVNNDAVFADPQRIAVQVDA